MGQTKMDMHEQNKDLPQVVTPPQGKSTPGSDRVKAPVATGSGTDFEGRTLCTVTRRTTRNKETNKTLLNTPRRQRMDSVSSGSSAASYAPAVDNAIQTTKRTATTTGDKHDLTELLRLIHETATKMAEAANVQKNMNMTVKTGIKTILKTVDIALHTQMEAATKGRLVDSDKTSMGNTNDKETLRTKRKRSPTGTTPETPQKKPPTKESAADWQTVTRKDKKQTKKKTDATIRAVGSGPAPRQRGKAVLVKPGTDMTYSDIVRKIRSTVDPKKSHVQVTTLRKTKNGLCLLKLQADASKPEKRDEFEREIQDAIGEAGSVRALTSKVQLEIMDLDCVASPDDVTDALRRETGRDVDFRVHIFGPNRAEQYMAVCELDSREAGALLRRGRIGIGWVHCRVRKRLTVTKCYRCLGFGLVKAECKGKDRTKCCRKCGASGHLATDCKSKPVCPLCSEAGHRNAFNSARWADILEALKSNFGIPPYLARVVEDYLKNRRIMYETIEGQVTRQVTAGVAQGSILGPDFWNGLYDSLLRLEMPLGVILVAYADDVAAVITERSPELAQLKLNQTMRRVGRWMTDHGLQLATEKTELTLLTRRRIQTILPMRVGAHETETKGEVKYLGVTFDTKMTFWPHIQKTAQRAAERIASLSRLMANTTGPRPGKRRLLMATAHSILLYGAEIWADSLKTKKYCKTMTMVQRQGALRIACSYRTVSAQAVLVVAGVIPVDLLAFERRRIYGSSADIGRKNAAIAERERTIDTWQGRWTNGNDGNWTRRLIRDLRPWLGRKFGDVNFYVTQLLTGHGYFRRYLHRMNRVRTPDCKYCGHERDDAEHTFFVCDRWTGLRQELEITVGSITPENIVGVMLHRPEWWCLVATYTETILRRKNADGCLTDD